MPAAGVDGGSEGGQASGRGHLPVMLEEAIEGLAIRPDGVYVDGTFGRGGHSSAIRGRLGEAGWLVAIDRDPQAVAVGRVWASEDGAAGRVSIEHAWFGQLDEVLDANGVGDIDGLLLDLGVSSPQLDDPARGFSFREDGPLDMRMDPTRGESAREWLLRASVQDITQVLREYGDERHAFQIATQIAARRAADGEAALATTGELARLVADVYKRRQRRPEVGKDPATRTFQAARVHVNQELAQLEAVLERGVSRLRPGGRLVVISFHSIEDRMVKQFISREEGRFAARDPIRGTPIHERAPRLRAVARKLPGKAEVAANPRARSAVLRIAERLPA